jgi:chemotaxis protein CheD
MVNINEVDVSDQPVVYTCYGLGSCVGLFVSDRPKGLAGAAHIPLPNSSDAQEWLGATYLINQLMERMAHSGSDLSTLRAKVAGGACVCGGSTDIGRQNAQAVLETLTEKRVFIASMDLGGQVSRTARFNSETGELRISTSENKTYCI